LKNKPAGLSICVAVILIMVTVLTGCRSSTDSFITKEANPNIDVLGIMLDMPESKVHESAGPKGEKAMCVYGYEYEYADKLINIGFKPDKGTVRRITTKNPDTSIYGIMPGADLVNAYTQVEANGFKKNDSSNYKFYKNNIIITIISMKDTLADGITIEINPD
jgi:hypothetical protein